MSEESEPVKPEPFPKPLPKRETGNTPEIENIEPETSPCPILPKHIKLFEDCCTKFEKGEMTDLEVMDHVIKSLRELKK